MREINVGNDISMYDNDVEDNKAMYENIMKTNRSVDVSISSAFFDNAMTITELNSVINGIENYYRYRESVIFYKDIIHEKSIDGDKIVSDNAKPFIKMMNCIFPLLLYLESEVLKAKYTTEIDGHNMVYHEKLKDVYDVVNNINIGLQNRYNKGVNIINLLSDFGMEYFLENKECFDDISKSLLVEVDGVKKIHNEKKNRSMEIIKQWENEPIINLNELSVATITGIRIIECSQYAIWDENVQIICLDK